MASNGKGHLHAASGEEAIGGSDRFANHCSHVHGQKERVAELIDTAIDAITRKDHELLAQTKVDLLLLGIQKSKLTEVCVTALNRMVDQKYTCLERDKFSALAREIGADEDQIGDIMSRPVSSSPTNSGGLTGETRNLVYPHRQSVIRLHTHKAQRAQPVAA